VIIRLPVASKICLLHRHLMNLSKLLVMPKATHRSWAWSSYEAFEKMGWLLSCQVFFVWISLATFVLCLLLMNVCL